MKKLTLFLVLLLSIPFFSQNYYDQQWKKVEENYRKGTFKSNLPIILEIQKQAMKDGNVVQLITSLKAEFSIINTTSDDTKNDAASQFLKEISTAGNSLKGKDKLLYDVVSGRFFNDYYSRNSWRVNGRTNVQRSDKEIFVEDVETWSNRDFKNYFTQYFTDLETRKKELQNIKLSDYKTIFSDVEYLDYFPSLLDWNAVNEIDFLKDRAFFTPKELQNNHQKIIAIYDNLITENQGNAKLYFQHQKLNYNCTFTKCKDKLSQLQNLYNSATEGDYKVMIIGEIMSQLSSERKYTEAISWAKTAKKEYPKSQFLGNIINKENEITNPVLVLKYETETLANQPIHLVAEAKNVNQFSLNIYELKGDFSNFLKYVQNPYSAVALKNLKKSLVRKQNFDLQNTKDYETYKTSLEIQPLPSGIYIVEYAVENTDVQHSFYFVVSKSKTIYINKNEKNPKENQLRLVDRNSGTSIANEELKIYEFGGKTVKTTNAKTDKSANFQLPISADDYRTFLVHQPKTNDFNIIQVYDNRYYAGPNPKNKAQIFLDRAIYRPGQIVYFKVINTQLLNNKESVASGISQKISLYDANGEELSSQNFTTNSFGSYHGSFVLPKGKLNGQFSLRIDDKNSYKSFRVEEYKRPKFEVTFEPIKGEYAYGQTIELKGKAEMFSGVALSNATVNYEIKKQNIRWRYFPWYPMGNDNENSILGETKTNEKGEFTITLNLQKNETLEGVQIDNYQVNASVTDINGETQSATENVRVASVSHYIKTDEIKDAFTDENMVVNVELRNYNDQILNKSYQAKLSKLSGNNRVFRQNFEYEIQDLPQYSEKEFIQKFPHDYFNKKEKENRVESVVWQRTENPENSTSKTLDLGRLDAGKYKLELYNIEGKDTIKTEKIFEVFSKKSLSPSQKTFLKVVSPKTEFNRNEKPKVYVYSAIPNALVNIFVQHGDGSTKTEQKTLKNGVLEYEVSFPKDENITFVNLQFQIVAYNDVQTERVNLKITSDKKPLQIETITFRDKLQPAQKEKWTVKISGNEKENINAELLANMYDMSLDQFAINSYSWQALFRNNFVLNSYGTRNRLAEEYYAKRINYRNNAYVRFPNFDWFANEINVRAYGMKQPLYAPLAMAKDSSKVSTIESVVVYETKVDGITPMENEQLNKIPIRENLNETAFFYPNLITDKNGNVSFEFTSPEALTKWKLMFLAHTKDAQVAVLQKEVVTQKEFSVTPNYPRFLREGDEINLQTKISSLINKKLSGTAQLQILDAFSNQDISEQFGLKNARQNFELNENGNAVATWKINVPKDISAIIIKVVATSTPLSAQGSFSDGEQKAIAVLPNRMLVTDAQPIFVKEGQTKTFTLKNLAENQSVTATNVSNTLELTTNPIWDIIFALPSLKNDQNNSADVVFNKWFADVLASEIFKANPRMKAVFQEYQDKGLLISDLEKNQELKQLLLEETPWIADSKNETEQMQKIARLFDVNMMKNNIQNDWAELLKLQNPDGGFSWHSGYPSSYQTSLYILRNLGKINEWLKGNVSDYQNNEQKEMAKNLIKFVDAEMENSRWFNNPKEIWSNTALDYLDARRYWEQQYPLKGKLATLKNTVIQKAEKADIKDFTFFGLHRAALLFDIYGLKKVSQKLIHYLKETSTETETQGVYWKQNLNHWGWYSAKTINHAGALEAFQKLTPTDESFIEEMKIWLVTQKEVNSWANSRATAEVIFTILNSGKSWTTHDSDKAEIIWGGKTLAPQTQATGYLKQTIANEKIDKNLATVTVKKDSPGIVQGGLFWQYYEDLDKIKSSESYISITKELYKKVKTENGEILQKISEKSPLKVGDKVTVRMILNTDRAMEFIHLKDMRAAGFEPLDVLSGYQWKNNLGYYQSTKDASTNFYIQYMPKGKYIFEYDYICNASGTFSGGITTLQNYYAPQMNAHTKGINVKISE